MTTRQKTKVSYQGETVDAEVVDVIAAQEPPNVYELTDGTVLTLKTTVGQVSRIIGKELDGNPVYVVKSNNVVSISYPADDDEQGG